jgi:hypothetical protein
MPDNQPDSLSPQTEAQVDVFQLLETLWREKLLIGLTILVFALGAMIYSGYAALTAPKAVTMYKVQMDIRPGITSYSDGFKAPVRGWTVDDIIAWINHRYYSPFLSNVDDVKATKGTAQTVTLSVLTLDPQKGQKMLNDLVSTWVRYYSDEGRDQNIAASQIALRNAIRKG